MTLPPLPTGIEMNLTKFAACLVPTGMTLPILAGPLRGSMWIAGAAAGDGKGLSIILNRAEPRQLQLARSWVTPESICFDIGANVGLYTLLFGKCGQHVYSFEPVPRNVHYLYRVVSLNRLPNVTILPWAVSDRVEFTRFALGDNCAVGKLAAAGTQPAACVSVDEFIERYGAMPDLHKIDVEGAEERVLRGACGLLAGRRPRILLSVHSPELRRSCLTLLQNAGYRLLQPLDSPDIENAFEFAAAESP